MTLQIIHYLFVAIAAAVLEIAIVTIPPAHDPYTEITAVRLGAEVVVLAVAIEFLKLPPVTRLVNTNKRWGWQLVSLTEGMKGGFVPGDGAANAAID